jgi:hypothetical protein
MHIANAQSSAANRSMQFDDVLGFVPPITKVLGQLSRQLVVDKEPHATRITAWFV